ncbi:hypothetical protein P9112_004466 [Eukaryota sp. TZLM1-RC]
MNETCLKYAFQNLSIVDTFRLRLVSKRFNAILLQRRIVDLSSPIASYFLLPKLSLLYNTFSSIKILKLCFHSNVDQPTLTTILDLITKIKPSTLSLINYPYHKSCPDSPLPTIMTMVPTIEFECASFLPLFSVDNLANVYSLTLILHQESPSHLKPGKQAKLLSSLHKLEFLETDCISLFNSISLKRIYSLKILSTALHCETLHDSLSSLFNFISSSKLCELTISSSVFSYIEHEEKATLFSMLPGSLRKLANVDLESPVAINFLENTRQLSSLSVMGHQSLIREFYLSGTRLNLRNLQNLSIQYLDTTETVKLCRWSKSLNELWIDFGVERSKFLFKLQGKMSRNIRMLVLSGFLSSPTVSCIISPLKHLETLVLDSRDSEVLGTEFFVAICNSTPKLRKIQVYQMTPAKRCEKYLKKQAILLPFTTVVLSDCGTTRWINVLSVSAPKVRSLLIDAVSYDSICFDTIAHFASLKLLVLQVLHHPKSIDRLAQVWREMKPFPVLLVCPRNVTLTGGKEVLEDFAVKGPFWKHLVGLELI